MGMKVDIIKYVPKNAKGSPYGTDSAYLFVHGYSIDAIRRMAIELILSGKVKDASKVSYTKRYPKNSYQVLFESNNPKLRDIGESTVGMVAYINGIFYYENPHVYKSLHILNMNGTLGNKVDRIRW